MTALAFAEACGITERIPAGVRWSVMITEDTAPDNTAALNIYVTDDEARGAMRQRLGLGQPDTESDDFEQHDSATPHLTISIIELKEKS